MGLLLHPISKLILLVCLLHHAAEAFSNTGTSTSSTAGHLEKYLLSNALKNSRRKGVVVPATTTSPSAIHVFSSESRTGESSKEALSALWDRLARSLSKLSTKFASSFPAFTVALSSIADTVLTTLKQFWWLSPMVLATIPVYHAVFHGVCVAMPDWWSVVEMHHIAAADNAPLVIGHFLGSNIAYFLSGSYLMLKRFPLLKWRKNKRGIKIRVTKFSLLGAWVCLAGLVSTIFHSVQALGSYELAQSLCYIDHAVAISAGAYFLDTCGAPSKRVWSIGTASLVTLAISSPGYAVLHSIWHYLSAATATLWTLEGYERLIDREASEA